jgi:hypothetical protein
VIVDADRSARFASAALAGIGSGARIAVIAARAIDLGWI